MFFEKKEDSQFIVFAGMILNKNHIVRIFKKGDTTIFLEFSFGKLPVEYESKEDAEKAFDYISNKLIGHS